MEYFGRTILLWQEGTIFGTHGRKKLQAASFRPPLPRRAAEEKNDERFQQISIFSHAVRRSMQTGLPEKAGVVTLSDLWQKLTAGKMRSWLAGTYAFEAG